MAEETMRGRDISRPMESMTIAGETYKLAFDFNAFRVAEDIYELRYGRPLNFGEIIQQLAAGKIGAIMAVLYGAIVSGGGQLSWADFSRDFKLTDIPQEQLMGQVRDALPTVDGNPPAPPQTAAT